MMIIVRLQAWARGSISRRKVKQRYGFQTSLGLFGGPEMEANYDNQTVQNIKEQLGTYNYDDNKPSSDGVKREQKEMFVMENGARYEGEWSQEKRDGKGQ
jgi:hypothetical protein